MGKDQKCLAGPEQEVTLKRYTGVMSPSKQVLLKSLRPLFDRFNGNYVICGI